MGTGTGRETPKTKQTKGKMSTDSKKNHPIFTN